MCVLQEPHHAAPAPCSRDGMLSQTAPSCRLSDQGRQLPKSLQMTMHLVDSACSCIALQQRHSHRVCVCPCGKCRIDILAPVHCPQCVCNAL